MHQHFFTVNLDINFYIKTERNEISLCRQSVCPTKITLFYASLVCSVSLVMIYRLRYRIIVWQHMLIQPSIRAPGIHHCWLAIGNVDLKLTDVLIRMTAGIEPSSPGSRVQRHNRSTMRSGMHYGKCGNTDIANYKHVWYIKTQRCKISIMWYECSYLILFPISKCHLDLIIFFWSRATPYDPVFFLKIQRVIPCIFLSRYIRHLVYCKKVVKNRMTRFQNRSDCISSDNNPLRIQHLLVNPDIFSVIMIIHSYFPIYDIVLLAKV